MRRRGIHVSARSITPLIERWRTADLDPIGIQRGRRLTEDSMASNHDELCRPSRVLVTVLLGHAHSTGASRRRFRVCSRGGRSQSRTSLSTDSPRYRHPGETWPHPPKYPSRCLRSACWAERGSFDRQSDRSGHDRKQHVDPTSGIQPEKGPDGPRERTGRDQDRVARTETTVGVYHALDVARGHQLFDDPLGNGRGQVTPHHDRSDPDGAVDRSPTLESQVELNERISRKE